MHTLKDNYQKNADILKENIKRGMGFDQVEAMIKNQKDQFKNHGLYNEDEKNYIVELINIKNSHFVKATTLAKQMGIEVVEIS